MLCGVTATLGSNPSATATAARPQLGPGGFVMPGLGSSGGCNGSWWGYRVIGHFVLLEGWLFGFLVRESRCFSWLGPTMRMDRSCCW